CGASDVPSAPTIRDRGAAIDDDSRTREAWRSLGSGDDRADHQPWHVQRSRNQMTRQALFVTVNEAGRSRFFHIHRIEINALLPVECDDFHDVAAMDEPQLHLVVEIQSARSLARNLTRLKAGF